jgi:predicted RNA binding protein YcfA (HicA-like mRNA interferase family)
VLAALKRDGWIETRRSGSHRVLAKGEQQRIWAYHDGVDLGGPAMALRVELFFDEEAGN